MKTRLMLFAIILCVPLGCARISYDEVHGSDADTSNDHESNCYDGEDNDEDGLIDCHDEDCGESHGCTDSDADGAVEDCSDEVDNDGDGQIDCDDSDCESEPGCEDELVERCADGLDNDGDARIDCDDSDCEGHEACPEPEPEECTDRIDNDFDLYIDCADRDCATDPACNTGMREICDDDIDNDGDGAVDCGDSDCYPDTPPCLMCPPVELCNDGLDNNEDGRIDCVDDWCVDDPICEHDSECDVYIQDCSGPDDIDLMCVFAGFGGSECVEVGAGERNEFCRRPTDCSFGLQCSSVTGWTKGGDLDDYYLTADLGYVEYVGGRCRPFCRQSEPDSCPADAGCSLLADGGELMDEGLCVSAGATRP